MLIVRAERLTEADLGRAGKLRVIARTGVGVDNIDVAAATRMGIPVVFAPGAGVRPIAEGAMALILAAAKRLGELGAVLRQDLWPTRYALEPLDLKGATLGIVGFGRIGREVAKLAASFGMRILACDPIAEPAVLDGDGVGVEFVDLPDLMKAADVVSLHCPLTDETRGMIDAEAMASMKPGAILVNVARGGVVASDQVLIDALERGQLSGLGLDVFEQEPPAPDSPLLVDPRVICTPHTIGLTRQWNQRVFSSLAADVTRVLAGQEPQHLANPAALSGAGSAAS